MRHLRMLASLVLAASLTAVPMLALGQSDDPVVATLPTALQPDGQLPLQGTPWRLRSYRHRGVDRAPGPEVAAWMKLGPDDLQASGGCTRIRGRYGITGHGIAFKLRDPKEKDCAEQTTMVQLAMFDGLRKAAGYEVLPSEGPATDLLVLRSATGVELLRFGLDDIAALDISEWRLISYTIDGETAAAEADQPAVLSFRPTRDNGIRRTSSGPLTGSTGCNGLVAEFHRHADVLSFSELDRTDAPCAPALATQETAIVSVLDATSLTLSLPPDHLTLTSADNGDSLDFVSSRPLEGSTWLLATGPWFRPGADAVTLWLNDDALTGEGPCGSYSGRYVTDGLFISFTDVMGSGDDQCVDPQAERMLLAALRSTVILDRDHPQLRMRDARGGATAAFMPPSGP